jgi:hypothetical protein
VFAGLVPGPAGAETRVWVDTESWPTLVVSVSLPRESGSSLRLFENGLPVRIINVSSVGRASTMALAVDHSRSMHGRALRTAVAIARQLLALKQPRDRIAVFAIGSKAVQRTKFSTSASAADQALRRIALDRQYGTALYDGVALAARALRDEKGRANALILLTDGQETTSRKGISDAVLVALNAHVPVYPVAIDDLTYLPDPLRKLARATRGVFVEATAESASTDYAAIAADIRRSWRIEYRTAARPGDTITLRIAQAGSAPQIVRVAIPKEPPNKPLISRGAVVGLTAGVAGGLVLLLLLSMRMARAPRPPVSRPDS